MDYTKFFILTQEERVLIRDDLGAEIEFMSIAELARCSSVDLTGKEGEIIQYEPHINHFVDSTDPAMGPDDIPYAPYETLISTIALLTTRMNDKTYGRTEAEAVPFLQEDLIKELSSEASRRRNIASDQPVAGFTPTIVGIYNEERVYRLNYINAKDAMNVALTQADQDFLLQNKPYWEYMRDISQVVSQAIDIIDAYTTIAECEAFDPVTTPPWPTWTPPAPV